MGKSNNKSKKFDSKNQKDKSLSVKKLDSLPSNISKKEKRINKHKKWVQTIEDKLKSNKPEKKDLLNISSLKDTLFGIEESIMNDQPKNVYSKKENVFLNLNHKVATQAGKKNTNYFSQKEMERFAQVLKLNQFKQNPTGVVKMHLQNTLNNSKK
ncbi:hypothetical protein CONCODRAFT_71288 [Conidiobolus coronatus NRRL 28638]|uniref:Ribosome biogenesis protein SLX9 n=1 Tax=Conidiobolus coronatus (strain ATCC 28846 / CBS 209.66 / NRRL 28638) TaxID=796925 RepID=A0A137P3Q1_CONC2|nr:hypothetical protein CONCODRAFT_71288 [Conidiobolus coronatus NRRL 28638]|eukprot:KXN69646.1 hypothetical protein CONCODRAFT_71288 [Conidiobolus coronatus NRRL 28638]